MQPYTFLEQTHDGKPDQLLMVPNTSGPRGVVALVNLADAMGEPIPGIRETAEEILAACNAHDRLVGLLWMCIGVLGANCDCGECGSCKLREQATTFLGDLSAQTVMDELLDALEALYKANEQLMPGIGHIACADYRVINEAPLQARKVLTAHGRSVA